MARAKKPKPSMRRVAEGIYQRPSGKYVAPVYDPDTKKRRYDWPGTPRGGFESLEDAKAFKVQVEADKAVAALAGTSRETCDQLAKRWVEDFPNKRGDSTKVHNAERIRKFARDFKGVPLTEVSRAQARQWALANQGHVKVVAAMYMDAARDGIVPANPFAKLGIAEPRGRSDILVLTELELRLLEQTAVRVWGEYGTEVFGPMIAAAAYTGMRPGELYALRRSQIDWGLDELHIRKQFSSRVKKETLPKNKTQRTITLLPRARWALQRVPAVPGTDYVFFNQEGERFAQRTLHYYWSPVRTAFWSRLPAERQEEIDPGFDFYEMRHFYGTHLATVLGLSPYQIADQMGHVDGGVLASKRYIHPVSKDVRAEIRKRMQDGQMGEETA